MSEPSKALTDPSSFAMASETFPTIDFIPSMSRGATSFVHTGIGLATTPVADRAAKERTDDVFMFAIETVKRKKEGKDSGSLIMNAKPMEPNDYEMSV